MGLAWFRGRRRRPGPYAGAVGLVPKLAVCAGAFVAAVLVAEAAGAANLGTALGIGQVVFAVVLVALLVRA